MSDDRSETYAVGQVARLTGVSPDLLRAWERRYRAIDPIRTPGGTRRYRASDIERLRLLKAAVDAGHRIGQVAALPLAELESRLVPQRPAAPTAPVEAALRALELLDGVAAEQQISAQMAALGPVRFAKEFALPLLRGLGQGWAEQRICVASEHLGSQLLRSLLGSALRPTLAHRGAPIVVFGTLPGERHEIGLLIAALSALGAGASPLYLGPDLPLDELTSATRAARARVLALGSVMSERAIIRKQLAAIRKSLPEAVELWLGGPGTQHAEGLPRVQLLDSLERLEQRVELLKISTGSI